jgi:hypothetical protein
VFPATFGAAPGVPLWPSATLRIAMLITTTGRGRS